MNITLNGTPIKTPNATDGFKHQRFEISKAERLANGTMVKDIIAVKQKFFFNYAILSQAEWDTIMNILTNGDAFFDLGWEDGGVPKTTKVYVGEIGRTAFRHSTANGWYWTDIAFNLIEQ